VARITVVLEYIFHVNSNPLLYMYDSMEEQPVFAHQP